MCQNAAQEWRIIMGILTRFKDIMSANINALLDKCEDPEKMIDQYMRNLESDLGKVKAETASVMAEETRCKRELDECTADVAKYQSYAEKALQAGNEADARTFLEKKQQLVSKQATLQQTYNIAADNAAKMRQMHDKLCKDIQSLEARRDAVKAKVAAAKAIASPIMTAMLTGLSVAGKEINGVGNGIWKMFLVLACVYFVMMFVGHLLLKKPAGWHEPTGAEKGPSMFQVIKSKPIGTYIGI